MLPGMGQSGDKSDLGQLAAFHLRGLRPSYAHRTVISSRPFVAGGGGLAGVRWGSFQHHRRVSDTFKEGTQIGSLCVISYNCV